MAETLLRQHLSCEPVGVSVAPGRVNLIGEHTDYNDGFVLPMNVERATRVAFCPRDDGRVRVYSDHAGAVAEFAVGEVPDALPGWARYVANVAAVLREAGLPTGGIDAAISSDVPVGGGLSSSASLECAVAGALLASAEGGAGKSLDDLLSAAGKARADLALLCQKAEHRVGALCGIMDQFVVLNGTEDHALLLDCRSLEATQVPLDGRMDVAVVVANSRVHHDLAANAYNERRRQCEAAVAFFAERLGSVRPIRALRDVGPQQWERLSGEMDPVPARRAGHVVNENDRTLVATASLERGDVATAGRCMNASHDSLRDLYEVSCPELDLLVEIARGVEGVYGSRMTGGGFGGCTVTLCRTRAVDALREALATRYAAETGTEPDVLVTRAAGRAHLEWRD
jgi:galactokinase